MWRRSIVMGLLVASCGGEKLTADVAIQFPSDHRNTLGELVRLEVSIFNPSEQICVDLIEWRANTCMANLPTCDGTKHEPQGTAVASTILEKSGETWPEIPLPLGEPAVRDVYIRGFTSSGTEPVVYGCATFDEDDATIVQLWRPWCDQDACDDILLPECEPTFRCENGEGRCRVGEATVMSWREDELGTCDVTPGQEEVGACQLATITCREDGFDFVPGVCPREEPICSDSRDALDLNCDGAPPRPCETACREGQMRSFREATGDSLVCLNQACVGGNYETQMRVPLETIELCNGWDDDCDQIRDEEAAANEACSREGLANRCVQGVCQCGAGPACEAGQACRNDTCVRVSDRDGGVIDMRDGGTDRPRDGGVVRRDAGFRDAGVSDQRDSGVTRRDGGRRRDAN